MSAALVAVVALILTALVAVAHRASPYAPRHAAPTPGWGTGADRVPNAPHGAASRPHGGPPVLAPVRGTVLPVRRCLPVSLAPVPLGRCAMGQPAPVVTPRTVARSGKIVDLARGDHGFKITSEKSIMN